MLRSSFLLPSSSKREITLVAAFVLTLLPAVAFATTSLDVLTLSPTTTITLDIAGTPTSVRAYRAVEIQNGGHAFAPSLGLPSTVDLTAYHRDAAGRAYFAVSAPVVLGGNTYTPDQVIVYNGATYSVHFDAPSAGVPPGINVDAFSMAPGRDLISFDASFTAGTLSTVPADLLAWDGAVFTREFDSVSEGISAGNLVAASHLEKVDRLLLSFDVGGVLGSIVYDDEDVLEFDTSTSQWMLNADTSDFDADWGTGGVDALYAEEGHGNVNVAEYATLRMVDVDPLGPPATFELRLDCGGHRITEISTAIVVHPNVSAANVTIGDCTVTGCGGASGFGPTVNPSSVFASFPPGTPPERPDAVTMTFPASGGGQLCNPNEDVLLADVSISGFATALPTPMLTQEGAGTSLREGGTLEKDMIGMSWGPDAEEDRLVFRAPIGDNTGLKVEVILYSPTQWHILGFAVLPPVGAANAIFGSCTVTAGPFAERSCVGTTDLGPTVDPASSFTLGPDASITTLGGYGNALYVTLQGLLATPNQTALNQPGKPTRLGVISYLPSGPGSLELGMPAIQGLGSGDLALTNAVDTQGQQGNGLGEGDLDPGLGGDSDADGQADDWDNCPTVFNADQLDSGGAQTVWNPSGLPGDEIGDACQCGDVSTIATDPAGIGFVNTADADLIRDALAENTALDADIALRCNVNGDLDQVEMGGLPVDCEISDAMALLRVIDGLDLPGDNLQQCVAP